MLHPLIHDDKDGNDGAVQSIADFTLDFSVQFSKWTRDAHFLSFFSSGEVGGGGGKSGDNQFLVTMRGFWLGGTRVPDSGFPNGVKFIDVFHRVSVTLKNNNLLIYYDRILRVKRQVCGKECCYHCLLFIVYLFAKCLFLTERRHYL